MIDWRYWRRREKKDKKSPSRDSPKILSNFSSSALFHFRYLSESRCRQPNSNNSEFGHGKIKCGFSTLKTRSKPSLLSKASSALPSTTRWKHYEAPENHKNVTQRRSDELEFITHLHHSHNIDSFMEINLNTHPNTKFENLNYQNLDQKQINKQRNKETNIHTNKQTNKSRTQTQSTSRAESTLICFVFNS